MKEKVIDILFESFYDNESVNFVIKQDSKKDKRIRKLLEYSYFKGENFGEIYLSENQQSAAILINPSREKLTLKSALWDLKLIFQCIGLKKVFQILKREKSLKQFKPKSEFMYLWYVGVKKEMQGLGEGTKLVEKIIEDFKTLPLHLETSNIKNFPFYEKLGFSTISNYQQKGYAVKIYTLFPIQST